MTIIYEKIDDGYYIVWKAEGGIKNVCSPTYTKIEYSFTDIKQIKHYFPDAISKEEYGNFF